MRFPTWRQGLALVLVTAQIIAIVHARFVDTRYFGWGPHDQQTEYFLEVRERGKLLGERVLRRRYGLGSHGWDSHSWANIMAVLRGWEERYGGDSEIRLRYRVNGKAMQHWSWP